MSTTAYQEIANIQGLQVVRGNSPPVPGQCPFEQFCEAIQQSNLPLSESETFMLAKLFSRSSSNLLNDTGDVDAQQLEYIRKGGILSMRLT